MEPRQLMGAVRGAEGAIEAAVPVTVVGAAWFVAYQFLGAPAAGRGMTWMEISSALGACVVLTGWMAGRQLDQLGKKGPWRAVITAWVYTGGSLAVFPGLTRSAFRTQCEETIGGTVVSSRALMGVDPFDVTATAGSLCTVGGVTDNVYLPGILFRPAWDFSFDPLMIVLFLFLAALGALGLRDVRIRPTRMTAVVMDKLRYAPAVGTASVLPPKPKDGQIQACSNATFWGEVCGQMYAADKQFRPGEACPRCRQGYTRCTRELTFKVVSLFTGDMETLNGLERTDTVGWGRGEPMPPDARISGAERWVLLGTITVPEVLSVAQMLALVHERLAVWAGSEDPRVVHAAKLAQRRSSRVSAWVWFGALATRLTYARPGERAVLALGSTRLRNLITDGGEEMWLQLDIGLLPLEIRTGFRKVTDDGRVLGENQKTDIWIPVAASNASKETGGVWVPRVEGDALRMWLSTDALRDDAGADSVAQPLPYYRYEKEPKGDPPKDLPRQGSLDFVRCLVKEGAEPSEKTAVGSSISAWEWLEPEQIQLLRQECLVLEERG